MARVPLNPEIISIGNCPKCKHFPTQFVAVEGGKDFLIHLPNVPSCDARGPGNRIQELEDKIRELSGCLDAVNKEIFANGATTGSPEYWKIRETCCNALHKVPVSLGGWLKSQEGNQND